MKPRAELDRIIARESFMCISNGFRETHTVEEAIKTATSCENYHP
tara:strand:+ start:216 stop:350 length:135 start_codon:yes stop_codon:yes gene_type:complete